MQVLSFSEQRTYTIENNPTARKDKQIILIQVDGIYLKEEVVNQLAYDNRVPRVRQLYSLVAGMYCIGSDLSVHPEAGDIWVLTVTYSTPTNVQETITDPTLAPALITVGTYKLQVSPLIDFDGKPVATTAGEPIDYTYQAPFPMYEISKNVKTFPQSLAKDRNFVNSDAVTIYGNTFSKYQLYAPDINISPQKFEVIGGTQYAYYTISTCIYANTQPPQSGSGSFGGWQTMLRNAGFHEKAIVGYKKRAYVPFVGEIGINPIYGLTAIKMGEEGAYHYPTRPVLIDKFGRAFRRKLDSDPTDGSNNRGPVIGLQIPGQPASSTAITPKQWAESALPFRFCNLVPFNTYFAMR